MIAPFAFLLTIAFVPGLAGAAIAPRWALLAIFLPWLFPSHLKLTAGHLAIGLLLGWSALSFMWGSDPYGGTLALAQLVIIASVFCIGASLQSLRSVYIAVGLGLACSSIVAIAQMLGWKGLAQFNVPGGLFFNPNFMAEAGVLVIVALLAKRIYWLIPLVAPAALLPQARGPLVALAIALAVWSRNKIVIWAIVAVFACAAVASVAFDYRISSVIERLAIWRDAMDGMQFFGHGIGSFYLQYPAMATRTDTFLTRPDHAHNDILEAIFELGPGAIFLVLVGVFAFLHGRNRTARLVLLAFAIESLVGFPLHEPVTAFLVALVAGHLCADGPSLRSIVAIFRGHVRKGYPLRLLRYAATVRKNIPA